MLFANDKDKNRIWAGEASKGEEYVTLPMAMYYGSLVCCLVGVATGVVLFAYMLGEEPETLKE